MLIRNIYIIITGLSILVTSCYSDYIHLKYDVYPGAQWGEGNSQIAFIASTSAYQKAKGIRSFPDGGIPKYLFKDVSLYLIDTSNLKLTKMVNFNDLEALMRNRWHADILYRDSLIYYKIKPTTDWLQYLSWAKNKKDSSKVIALREKYSKAYYVNTLTKNVEVFDSIRFFNIIQENTGGNKINLTELNKLVSKVPVVEWGLKIQDISPKPDSKYIDDIIYVSKDGASLTKRAIIEQIISQKSQKEKREILEAMDKYKNSLTGLKKTEYELYSKESYELIRELL